MKIIDRLIAQLGLKDKPEEYNFAAELVEEDLPHDEEQVLPVEVDLVVQQLAHVEGLTAFLDDMANKDVRMYFAASNDKERDMIKGGFFRMKHLKKLIVDQHK